GGCRSAALTLPGFLHDVCSAFHPMGAASPFFRALDLGREGLEWIEPPAALAHPLDDGTAVLLERSIDATASGLGADGRMYRGLADPTGRLSADRRRARYAPAVARWSGRHGPARRRHRRAARGEGDPLRRDAAAARPHRRLASRQRLP